MSQLAILQSRRAEMIADAQRIVDGSTGRFLTSDEQRRVGALLVEVSAIDAAREKFAGNALLAFDESPTSRAENRWNSFAEQLVAVQCAAQGQFDGRLLGALGNNENVDAEGGFLVAPDFAEGILRHMFDVGELASRCNQFPMKTNRKIVNAVDDDSRVDGSRWGGIQAYWQIEAAAYTATKPKFRQMVLNANKITALIYASEELTDDAAAFAVYADQAVSDEFSFKIDDAIYNGNGAGIPLGILKSGALITIAAEGGQTAATIVTNNILKMWQRMPVRSRKTAVWLVNADVEAQLYPLSVGSGALAELLSFVPAGVNGNPYALLMGRPVIPIEQAATLGTVGDIVLVDLQQYLLATKTGGIRSDVSIHVQFLTGEQAFRFQLRVDGQPMWKKPLTPKNGTNLQSPFVTLAAR